MTQKPVSPSSHFPAGRIVNTNGDDQPGTDSIATTTRVEAPTSSAGQPTKRQNSTTPDQDRKSLDNQLVDETKNQIRLLVQEIADLAKTDCTIEEFYEGFLTRTTSALASIGGAIWIREEGQQALQLQYHINLKKTGLVDNPEAQARHHKLLQRMVDRGEPALIRPDSASSTGDQAGNPTDFLLVIGPLSINKRVVGLVEIFQRPGAGPTTQRGYQRFVLQMCDIASEFLANEKIRDFAVQQQLWQQLAQFTRLVHRGLDTQQTIYTIANESRRLLDCDRVSVATGNRRGCQIKTVSGLDSIERRADQVKKLGELTSAVIKTEQPLWYSGDSSELPPQIDSVLQDYVDRSHTKMVAIVPLFDRVISEDESESTTGAQKPQPIGALIVEQLKDSRISPALRQRVDFVAEHSQTALANSNEHNQIFLMPVWKTLGKFASLFHAGQRTKTLAVAALVAAAVAFLCWFPYEFGVGANGALIPETQFEVFAQSDGKMESVWVSDTGDTVVKKHQLLGQMVSNDVDLAISEINGKIAEAKTQTATAKQRLSAGNLDINERFDLERQLNRDKQAVASLSNELQIRLEEKELLKVVSPADGIVVNWNVKQKLLNRPVKLGQNLMTIVPPDAVWLLELQMPERRLIHLLEAMESSAEPVRVTFGLVSNPGTEYEGQVLTVDRKLDVYSDDGNAALVRVAFDNRTVDPTLLRSETRVTAKILCGERSIGYVMFHELIETVQSQWMFWF